MTDLAASLGLVQLTKLESCNQERRRLLERYREAFSGLDGITLLDHKDYTQSACYNAVVKVEARDELYSYLDECEIDSNVHYYPNHLLPLYRPYTTRLPVTESEWQRILSIPLFPDLGDADQDRVIDRVRAFVSGEAAAARQA